DLAMFDDAPPFLRPELAHRYSISFLWNKPFRRIGLQRSPSELAADAPVGIEGDYAIEQLSIPVEHCLVVDLAREVEQADGVVLGEQSEKVLDGLARAVFVGVVRHLGDRI